MRTSHHHTKKVYHTPTKMTTTTHSMKTSQKHNPQPTPTIPRMTEITGKVGRCRRGTGGAGNELQRQHAAVAVTRPAAAARKAKEGLTLAAREETEASRWL
jgi:hypothetical protein